MGEAQTNANGGVPPEVFRQLRQIGREFKEKTLPQLKARRYFVSKSERRRKETGRFCRTRLDIKFTPFALTLGLGNGSDVQPTTFKRQPVQTAIAPSRPGQIVSVFVIATIATTPLRIVLQKIKKKVAPGFPGGGIEEGEEILQAAAREFKEETRGKDSAKGVNILPYNPLCIGKTTLHRATNGEQGAIVLVEIPESEIANLEAGGGAEEGEVVETISCLTFEEVENMVKKGAILPNSINIWNFFLKYLDIRPAYRNFLSGSCPDIRLGGVIGLVSTPKREDEPPYLY